ncbi:AGC family protein kinase [Tritrichomonas foetus]|uniref:AGC family protein kinase n=1 Tax=Tritrichomonas foetus TaxID=1144522 RepID=A0A1J4KI53_9EUKA|nr:AGC family protein kinase [Tritrichomonas foetus]|eukprot:OHT10899.1 AGC family protein kinase [Tritrichomonas foetus]
MFYQTTIKRKNPIFKFWEKCFIQVSQSNITIKKNSKTDKKLDLITVQPDTKIEYTTNGGKGQIVIVNGTKKLILLGTGKSKDMLECLIAARSAKFYSEQISLNDFQEIDTLGCGSFGLVKLVQHNTTKKLFALKSVEKNNLYATKAISTILSEMRILKTVNHPFLVDLQFAFQNSTHFFLGLEFVPGGDLHNLINRISTIPLDDAKIYIAEIAIALNYLHSRDILYRDLKPENVLIGRDGHLKLTDFGLSKDISKFKNTASFCGTLDYIAPEIVRHLRYSTEVDYYQLGVLTYEMMFKRSPFPEENRLKKMDSIMCNEPEFPENTNEVLVDLIKGLMNKDPSKRMKYEDIVAHKFFEGLSFEEVEQKLVQPSFIPSFETETDTKYFDKECEIQETKICIEDNNLFKEFEYIADDFFFTTK